MHRKHARTLASQQPRCRQTHPTSAHSSGKRGHVSTRRCRIRLVKRTTTMPSKLSNFNPPPLSPAKSRDQIRHENQH